MTSLIPRNLALTLAALVAVLLVTWLLVPRESAPFLYAVF